MDNNWQLYWGQGQFLTPQHFQQQDLFHMGRQHFYWRLGNPFGWGILSLEISEQALLLQRVEILRCQVLTRDGLLLQGGKNVVEGNAEVLERAFQGLMDPGGGPMGVYLGLPYLQPNQTNLQDKAAATQSGAVPPRYNVFTRDRQDLFHVDRPAASLSFVDNNVRIYFDRDPGFEQAQKTADLIKIAELLPVTAGVGARLSSTYIPPCLKISSAPALLGRLRDLRDLMTAKAQEFEGLKRQRQDPLRIQMMQTLGRHVPALHHLCEVGHTHPEPVYGLLRQMLGEFSAYTEEVGTLGALRAGQAEDLFDLPAYNHEQIALCYGRAIGRLMEVIRNFNVGSEAGIPLVRDGRLYRASLAPSLFESERTLFYLMIEGPVRGDQLWERLRRTGKISPFEDMQRLLASALFGLKIELVTERPEHLPKGANKTFFKIDSKDISWGRIKEKQNIAVYCDLDPNETSIRLFAIREA